MTPSNFIKRHLGKSYLLTKAKFYLVNPSNLAKTETTLGKITLEQQINPVHIPYPCAPSRAQCTVKCPGYATVGPDHPLNVA